MKSDLDKHLLNTLIIDIPFLNKRLASTALEALRVDPELSPFVRRNLTIIPSPASHQQDLSCPDSQNYILRTLYEATTIRVLRVALNGFMESLSVVIGAMEELDIDSLSSTAMQS